MYVCMYVCMYVYGNVCIVRTHRIGDAVCSVTWRSSADRHPPPFPRTGNRHHPVEGAADRGTDRPGSAFSGRAGRWGP